MQFLSNGIQGEISSQILDNILYGVFYNVIGRTIFGGFVLWLVLLCPVICTMARALWKR